MQAGNRVASLKTPTTNHTSCRSRLWRGRNCTPVLAVFNLRRPMGTCCPLHGTRPILLQDRIQCLDRYRLLLAHIVPPPGICLSDKPCRPSSWLPLPGAIRGQNPIHRPGAEIPQQDRIRTRQNSARWKPPFSEPTQFPDALPPRIRRQSRQDVPTIAAAFGAAGTGKDTPAAAGYPGTGLADAVPVAFGDTLIGTVATSFEAAIEGL